MRNWRAEVENWLFRRGLLGLWILWFWGFWRLKKQSEMAWYRLSGGLADEKDFARVFDKAFVRPLRAIQSDALGLRR